MKAKVYFRAAANDMAVQRLVDNERENRPPNTRNGNQLTSAPSSRWQDIMGAMMKILDTRLNEQEAWFNAWLGEQEAWFNDRLGEQKAWFDARLGEQEAWFNARLNEQDASFDAQLNKQKAEFTAQLNGQEAELNVRMDKLRTQLDEHESALCRITAHSHLSAWALFPIMLEKN